MNHKQTFPEGFLWEVQLLPTRLRGDGTKAEREFPYLTVPERTLIQM